ncbi:hypothetical protein DBR40_24870 [Pedobacter sp. KBW01]|uniref:hypothetical protein n=1 Tax=Pedobacter sp. KBW01 TaxID=2153364 RepID=UPI000F5ACBB7|nr:hypothetical protein [Pedobacter sp. KBW01]RQO65107.1 hypothetical protein DBR40_24870 [Pedobacter sp. KBW01]
MNYISDHCDIIFMYKGMTKELRAQSHISATLTLEEREKIKMALPISISHGYRLISEKLPHLSKNQISQVFTIQQRYRPEVIDAAFEVIAEFNKKVGSQKKKAAEL